MAVRAEETSTSQSDAPLAAEQMVGALPLNAECCC